MKNILFLFLTSLVLFSCAQEDEPTENEIQNESQTTVTLTDAQYANAGIATGALRENSVANVLRVNGKIDVPPQNTVSVSVPMGGYLKSTHLLPGMRVRKGEVIATLEDPQYIQLQQDYLVAKSKLHFAELDYARQKELNQSQASSDKVTQQAQAEVQFQTIALNALAEKLRMINKNPASISPSGISRSVLIYSTINGYVSKVHVNLGRYVTPSDVMFELINPNDLHLNLRVLEKDVQDLVIGQPIRAYTNARPDKVYRGKILLIGRDITPEGMAEVHCHLESPDASIFPGMYMNAEVQLTTSSSRTLPEESVVRFEGKEYVFVARNKYQYELQEIRTGLTEKGQVEVSDQAPLAGKTIVTSGAYTLLMKLKNKGE
jgi:membrane fusion protein, heavy metal efflux system